MKLLECYADGYKNLNQVHILPDQGINIIYGKNAQGKTNLIDSIGLFSGRRSFRSSGEGKLIGFDRRIASLQVTFDDGKRSQTGEIVFGRKNKFLLNRVPLASVNEFSGTFYTIVFSPNYLVIVQGEPRVRRKFLDDAILQIRPDYGKYCRQYEKILAQRNALLKNADKPSPASLEVWNLQLAQLGTIITMLRQDYTSKLSAFMQSIYYGISTGHETLSLEYQSTVFDQQLDQIYTEEKVQGYLSRLEQNQQQDFAFGHTGVGVHRDDLLIRINRLSARDYGSQGQQRSCVIALKLAEAKLLKSISGSEPVILLDDVMSELDTSRQDYILNHVKHNQIFITCCDISNTLQLRNGTVFHMENGQIQKQTKEQQNKNVS